MSLISSQVFKGNRNNNSVVINSISNPVQARFVRFVPQTWKNSIAMRVEVYGEVTGKTSVLFITRRTGYKRPFPSCVLFVFSHLTQHNGVTFIPCWLVERLACF